MQPVTPSLWRRAGQVLLSFFAFALIICAFPPFVNPPGCAWMQFASSLVPRSHCRVVDPCSPRGSSSAPAAGRRAACPPQVRALRLLPTLGLAPSQSAIYSVSGKGKNPSVAADKWEPRPARGDLPPPLPQAEGRRAHRRCGLPRPGTDPTAGAKKVALRSAKPLFSFF